jgi:hypothetical protein
MMKIDHGVVAAVSKRPHLPRQGPPRRLPQDAQTLETRFGEKHDLVDQR